MPVIHSFKRKKTFLTTKSPKIDSDDPETVYKWLDKFEENLVLTGKSYEYPEGKFIHSKDLSTSEGYRRTIYAHKKFKREQTIQTEKGKSTSLWRKYNLTVNP